MRFKIDWASLIFGSNLPFLLCFTLYFEGNFPSTSPQVAYIWRSNLMEGFLRYELGGLIFVGAYTWRAYFRNYGNPSSGDTSAVTMRASCRGLIRLMESQRKWLQRRAGTKSGFHFKEMSPL